MFNGAEVKPDESFVNRSFVYGTVVPYNANVVNGEHCLFAFMQCFDPIYSFHIC